jgi:hypothetical protein
MQRIFLQQIPATSSGQSPNNFLQNSNRPTNITTSPTTSTTTSTTTTSTTTSTNDSTQPIIYKDVNGNTSPLGNVLTTNYGLFLQSYAPTSNLSQTYGIIVNSKGEPYTLTQNYSVIPTTRNYDIYNV